MITLECWNCGEGLQEVPRPISRQATCPACFNELHCCRLCRYFDASSNMACFEDRAEPPLQKDNANFCEYFSPQSGVFDSRRVDRSSQARGNLDALFGTAESGGGPASGEERADPEKDKPASSANEKPLSAEEQARKKLDDLFD